MVVTYFEVNERVKNVEALVVTFARFPLILQCLKYKIYSCQNTFPNVDFFGINVTGFLLRIAEDLWMNLVRKNVRLEVYQLQIQTKWLVIILEIQHYSQERFEAGGMLCIWYQNSD